MQYRSLATTAAAAASSVMTAIERRFLCSDGITIAALSYQSTTTPSPTMSSSSSSTATNTVHQRGKKVLCLHGWLDNAASFHIVAPELVRRGSVSDVVSLDLPGHGMSSHKSSDCPPQLLADYIFYIADVIKQLHWLDDESTTSDGVEDKKITLIGHSMGAAISVIFASCFPEKVESVVLLDGFAPLPKDARDISTHIRKAVETRLMINKRLYPQFSTTTTTTETVTTSTSTMDEVVSSPSIKGHNKKVYQNINKAVEARIKTATSSPGSQYISQEAAYALVKRATTEVVNKPIDGSSYNSDDTDIPVQFRHDPRLYWPSMQYLTTEQVEAVLTDIRCPVCLLMAKDGWPIDAELQRKIVDHILKPKMYQTLPGSHHFHADPETATAVVDTIDQFLKSL
jgi:pimeloyl-ACP methyl ester carboxylesterase